MQPDFYAFVEDAVKRALPAGHRPIAPDKLPGKGAYKIRHGFPILRSNGSTWSAYVLVLPYSFRLTRHIKRQIITLRNDFSAQNCLLIVI